MGALHKVSGFGCFSADSNSWLACFSLPSRVFFQEHDTDSSDDESDAPALSQDVGEDSGDEEAGFVSKRSRDSPAKREEWTPPTVVPPATGIVRRAPTPLAPNSSR